MPILTSNITNHATPFNLVKLLEQEEKKMLKRSVKISSTYQFNID